MATAAAERMAIMRERRARGETVVTMLLGRNAVAGLVALGLLDDNAVNDANAVTVAVSRHLHHTLVAGVPT